jgi:hypothetical protein
VRHVDPQRLQLWKEIELSVGAFSNLAGVLLVCSFMVTGLNGLELSSQSSKETKEDMTLVEYTLQDNEAEISTPWRHPMGKHSSMINMFSSAWRAS